MTYFITIEELKQTTFNTNLDNEYIAPALEEAQSIYLREIIGDLLYNSITNKIDSETLSDKYLTLVNQYIKPYLTYKVQSVIVIPLNNKTRNAGIINQYDQGFNTSTMKDTAYLADHYNSRAEFYANRLTTYLQKNAADFPEYGYSDDNITQPTETQNVTTIYLGGGRKKCGCSTPSSGGGSSSVDWDDIRNKPDFATVATSGDYEDLENRPNIPTVNNATLTIKQGGTTKGTFTANAGTDVEINLESGGSGSTDWSDITNKPDFATVATSGNYNDLSNRPDLNDYVDVVTYNQKMNDVDNALDNRVTYGVYTPKIAAIDNTLADKVDTVALCTINNERLDTRANFELVRTDSIATLTIKQGGTTKGTFTPNSGTDVEINLEAGGGGGSTDWSDITNKPNFATVATSGDYEDLTNKPTIPTVPTNVSAFTNDAGYTTFDGDYNSLTNKPTIPAAQVNSDWNAVSGVAQILNKPSLATVATSGNYSDLNGTPSLATVATSGDYDDLQNKPTIPSAQVNSDWNASSGVAEILNKPTLATVATTGDYTDLTNKPTIPAAPVQSDWNESDTSSLAYIANKPTIPASPVQSDWNESDTSSLAYITNKPTIPAAQVQTDWNANSGMGQLLNKPSMATETWTFTLSDNTTVTKTVWLQPTV